MGKEWIIQQPWEARQQAGIDWNLSPLVAQLLYNRGVETTEQAKAFLAPQMIDLIPPEILPGNEQAAEIISEVIAEGGKIVLYGDYDVDGITGVAILWHLLKKAGADVSYYVPHRVEEGYGLNSSALKTIIDEGARLIISVDCGITSVAEAQLVADMGARLIITDHHQSQAELPAAAAIVHPGLDGNYPNPDLCGAGVAFKLAWLMAQKLTGAPRVSPEYRQFLIDALALAALGTIADVVSLTGENRVIARCGLSMIKESPWPGVRALIDVSGLADSAIDGTAVGFKLAPRINAAGRMGHARLAIDLLTWADENRAREIALYLDEHNRNRQAKQRKYVKQASEMIERAGFDGDTQRAIVLAAEDWHPGIIGIVAARIVDEYNKPTVLISLSNGVGQGSARSIPYFELHKALEDCSEFLVSHGGHAMAAGLRIEEDKIPAFTESFIRRANNSLSGTAIVSKLHIDSVIDLEELSESTVLAINNLGPFGTSNPKPVLASDWLTLAEEPRCVGRGGDHLQCVLRQNGAVIKAIAFGAADQAEQLKEHRKCRVAFEPIINEFKGRRSVEMQVVDFKFPDQS